MALWLGKNEPLPLSPNLLIGEGWEEVLGEEADEEKGCMDGGQY